jgi:hypothetical protein
MPLILSLAASEEVMDRVVRYVNDDIITVADMRLRLQARIAMLRQRGAPLPQNAADWQALHDELLVELTDELLLLGEADRFGVTIDERPLRRRVEQRARRYGENATLAMQQRAVEEMARSERIQAVLRFFAQGIGAVTPAAVEQAYRADGERYARPARWDLVRLTLRVADDDARAAVREALLAVFRRAQTDADPTVAGLVDEQTRSDFIAARKDQQAQQAILLRLAEAVVAVVPAATAGGSGALRDAAVAALAAHDGLLDTDGVTRRLQELQARVSSLPPAERADALRVAAEAWGTVLVDGWQEEPALAEAVAAAVADVAVGELSPLFPIAGGSALVLVRGHEPASRRPLAEVHAEIRGRLEAERRQGVQERLLLILRERAHLRDLEALDAAAIESAAALDDGAAKAEALLELPR